MASPIDLASILAVALATALGGVIGSDGRPGCRAAEAARHMLVAGATAISIALTSAFGRTAPALADPTQVMMAISAGVSLLGLVTSLRDRSGHAARLAGAASLVFAAGVAALVMTGEFALAVGATIIAAVAVHTPRQAGARPARQRARQYVMAPSASRTPDADAA